MKRLKKFLRGADMVFVTAGEGGGTGTWWQHQSLQRLRAILGALNNWCSNKVHSHLKENFVQDRQKKESKRYVAEHVDTLDCYSK
jgi:cell division GTPase FtsZ